MLKNYYKPTPRKWRRIGDAILLLSTTLTAIIPSSPLGENGKVQAMFFLSVIGTLGKVATNFFKEEEAEEKEAQESSQHPDAN